MISDASHQVDVNDQSDVRDGSHQSDVNDSSHVSVNGLAKEHVPLLI